MAIQYILNYARKKHIKLELDGDKVTFKAPPDTITPGFINRLRKHKPELIRHLGQIQRLKEEQYIRCTDCKHDYPKQDGTQCKAGFFRTLRDMKIHICGKYEGKND